MNNSSRIETVWRITVILYACLIGALAVDHIFLRTHFFWFIWLIQTLPLLTLIPGLIAKRIRSGIWLCFILLFFFLMYIDQTNIAIMTHNDTLVAAYAGLVALCSLLFMTSLLFARWSAQFASKKHSDTSLQNENDTE
jgi:uncharacterized membrane protein